jgi:hypothetical protein
MKAIITTTSLLLVLGTVALGQTVTVKGTVNNQKGQPIPYAFVRDAQHNYATFADSAGAFKIKVDPSSTLSVAASNYKDAQLKLDNKTDVNIVLSEGGDDGNVASLKSGDQGGNSEFLRARDQVVKGSGAISARAESGRQGGAGGSDVTMVKSGFVGEPTRGSRYLYEDWVPGFGINKEDGLVVEKTNMYNYDKIGGDILFTNDGKSMARVSTSQLKSFTLYDKKGHAHLYENAPEINDKPFVEVLLKTSKYIIYKRVDTKLSKADYHTDGVLEMGHKYDEYQDIDRYFFVNTAENKPHKISLKKSVLKNLMGGDADAFIAAQGSRDVDEEYVKELGASLNNK